ncbi:MAG TPA: inositol monophosphatase family protein [Candidatus Saccharimonadales bacterium]|nr:inositol monophosphatase family protein [Candidatus Saccharimonadales bacterium]
MDYEAANKTLQDIAREAGAFMLGSDERESTDKTNVKDFVTVADIKSQNIIRGRLNAAFPGVAVLSEEDPEEARAQLFEPTFTGFVLDPIDGTYNFKRDMRESAISIGYIEGGRIKAGVIFDPYKNELFTVTEGKGAFRNGQPIHVSGQDGLAGASIATSNSYDDEPMVRNLNRHLAIYEQTGIMPWMVVPGSGVLLMANIACGRIDVYHHNGLKPWDNAVAFLLIREAGGKVLTLKGEEAAFTSATILGGTPAVVDALDEVFKKIDQTLLD